MKHCSLPVIYSSTIFSSPLLQIGWKLSYLLSYLVSSPPYSGPHPTKSPISLSHILCFSYCELHPIPHSNPKYAQYSPAPGFFPWRSFPGSPSYHEASPAQIHESVPDILPLSTSGVNPFIPIFPLHVVYTKESVSCSCGGRCHVLATMGQAQLYCHAHIGARKQRLREVLLEWLGW